MVLKFSFLYQIIINVLHFMIMLTVCNYLNSIEVCVLNLFVVGISGQNKGKEKSNFLVSQKQCTVIMKTQMFYSFLQNTLTDCFTIKLG